MIPIQIGHKEYEVKLTFKNLLLLEDLLGVRMIDFMNMDIDGEYPIEENVQGFDKYQLEFENNFKNRIKKNEFI